MKYLRVYWVSIKNNWVREAVYRSDFLTSLIVDIVWVLVEAGLFEVIYANTTTLAGWTKPQVFFFLGIFFATDALYTVLFNRSFWMFPDLVNKGELDILLTKPIHSLFLALTRWISIAPILNIVFGVGICIYYAEAAGFAGGAHWFLVPLWLIIGCAFQTVMRFLFVCWVFWTERGFALARMYYQLFQLATKPHTIYPAWLRWVLMTALPFAFIASVPAQTLLQGGSIQGYLWAGGVFSVLFGLAALLWRSGLRRYVSASS